MKGIQLLSFFKRSGHYILACAQLGIFNGRDIYNFYMEPSSRPSS